MTMRWERRVRGALVSQHGASIHLRLSAGLLLAGNLFRRWLRRTVIAITVVVTAALAAAPVIAAVALLVHLL